MMILPLADALMNCFQNLTSRIAGVDNEQMTSRVMGIGTMLGFGIGAIKEQFKTPASKVNNEENTQNSGFKGFINRAKSVVNPSMNLSVEKDYNGNVNPIRNVEKVKIPNSNSQENLSNNVKTVAGKVVKTGFNATKAYLNVGASMAEGDFSRYSYRANNKRNENKNDYKNIEYINKLNDATDTDSKNLGDKNDYD